jgi:hypothetical protein
MLDPSGGPHDHDRWKQFGFLLADLFLVLALLFLLMTISSQAQVRALQHKLNESTPTPTVTPTPSKLPRLSTKAVKITLNVDWNGLLAGTKSAQNGVLDQIHKVKALQGRRAGLVIAYGGTQDLNGVDTAKAVVNAIYKTLQTLDGHGQLFEGTVYHDFLFTLNHDHSYVQLEVYLFELD